MLMEEIELLIEKLKINLNVPKINDKQLLDATYILIRHAYSEYNYRAQQIVEEFGEESEEMMNLKSDSSLYDPGLHQIGVIQAESNQELVNCINFKVVFVSPLQRTLQTCIHLFKKHPNKENIRFVVLPIGREVLETANDIALDIDHIMEKYGTGKEICCGLDFDFSLTMLYGAPKLWQIFTLANLQKQKELIESLKVDDRGESNHKEIILQKLVDNQPRYEKHKDLFERAKVIKKFLREYIEANPLENTVQEKYGIISHSRIIATLTASGVRESDDALLDYMWYKNCEMRAFSDY